MWFNRRTWGRAAKLRCDVGSVTTSSLWKDQIISLATEQKGGQVGYRVAIESRIGICGYVIILPQEVHRFAKVGNSCYTTNSSWVPSSTVEQRPFKPWVLGSNPRGLIFISSIETSLTYLAAFFIPLITTNGLKNSDLFYHLDLSALSYKQ